MTPNLLTRGKSRCLPAAALLPLDVKCAVSLVGGAPIFLGVRPYPVEVYNDLDSTCLSFFEALRDKVFLKKLQKMFSKLEHEVDDRPLLETARDAATTLTTRLMAWALCGMQLFKAHAVNINARKLFKKNESYRLFRDLDLEVPYLEDFHGRLFRMQFEHYRIKKIMEIYDGTSTLFFVDLDHAEGLKIKRVIRRTYGLKGRVVLFSANRNTLQIVEPV